MENIGSGTFAEIHRGLFQEYEGQDPPLPVTVKLIEKKKTTPEARIKLLQEAAVMGQFHHPKVR